MLETLFGSVLTAGITAASFTVCLIAALALGALVAAVYMYKNTCTQSMAVTLALLPAMVQIIILLVNGNLGAGVAVSGAFGLVRFRSAPGSARDITCIFLAMTLGLATGMGYIGIAVVTGAAMCLLLLVYAALSFGRRPEEEKELNRIFGRQMAAACSIAILIGKKRSEPLHEGLREGGFAEENIHVVANLDEATALLARTTQPGDVVLFENDLPDNYDE